MYVCTYVLVYIHMLDNKGLPCSTPAVAALPQMHRDFYRVAPKRTAQAPDRGALAICRTSWHCKLAAAIAGRDMEITVSLSDGARELLQAERRPQILQAATRAVSVTIEIGRVKLESRRLVHALVTGPGELVYDRELVSRLCAELGICTRSMPVESRKRFESAPGAVSENQELN